jgi:creatinine amidohydrolase
MMLSIFNTSDELAQSNIDTAVLPLGSVEPKGPHLPVGFDLILANQFAKDFCTGKAVYLLPVFPFSTAMEARGFRGAVALQQQTLWDVLNDLASVLARHGFKRLVVLDFSNYNWIVKHCIRELNLNLQLIQAVWVNPKEFAKEDADPKLLPDYGGGAVETSLALALDDTMVQTPAEDFDAGTPREYIDYNGLAQIAPRGFWGKPTLASIDLGKSFYGLMLDKTRQFVGYALGLIQEGASIAEHDSTEIWWPKGNIPGIQNAGVDWYASLSSISEAGTEMVIIPIGATEQHSPSQPLATDYLQALMLGSCVAAELGAYLLPALPVLTSWGHIHFRGSLTLGGMTARRLLEDIAASLYRGGFTKAVILNIHGGNWVIKPTMIEINRKFEDFKVISNGDLLAYRGQAPVEQLHACEVEASFIKAFYPESFKADRLLDYTPNCSAAAFDLVGIQGVSPQGVWGYPSKASAEKGRDDLQQKVADTVAYVRSAFSHNKTSP